METGRGLPNLRALGVFEAAAERQNFTEAAATLDVTQAAVSKSIRLLEDELGCALFERRGRAVALTEAGRILHERCRSAFDYIEDGCAIITAQSDATTSIAANTAVSHFWLAPALHAFSGAEPSVSVRLVTSDNDRDLLSGDTDLAILHGHEQRIGWTQTRLFTERLMPVATRSWLDANGLLDRLPLSPREVAALPILDHLLGGVEWTNFGSWLRFAGLADEGSRHRVFSRYTLAIDAMLAGEGVALGSVPLLPSSLHGHGVVAVSDVVLDTGRAYHLAVPSGAVLDEATELLMNWLIGAAAEAADIDA